MELVLVEGQADSLRWREQMEPYRYLGCRVPYLRYWVRHHDGELACLLWNSPAWKMQARDEWIGWNDEQGRHHLQVIVNNGRFLIVPWVQVKGLASKILSLSARPMPRDWETRYGCRPLLLEKLVDATVFAEPATGRPTGFQSGRPAVAWIASTNLTVKRSKTFTSIR